MALHKRSDFAKICGISNGNLSNYIKRGKLILSGDYVDDSIPQNKLFLDTRLATKGVSEPSKPEAPKVEAPKFNGQIPDDYSPSEPDDGDMTIVGLNKREKKVNIQKKQEEIKLLKLKEEKIRGQVVPIDVIKNLFRSHTQSIVTAQKDGIEELLINISGETRISGEQLAKLRGKMVEHLNNAVDKAISVTSKTLGNILREFKDKKEVGERA